MKRVFFRENGIHTTDYGIHTHGVVDQDVIGWLRTASNIAGFCVYPLSNWDIEWFKSQDQSTDNVYRVITDKNNTTLIKLRLSTGMVSFFDNAEYELTDKISWERFSPYGELHVDSGSAENFGIME